MSESAPDVEVVQGRAAEVGGVPVLRHLPTRQLRTVGAWCFADEMGPIALTPDSGMDVGPHPHTGLQTVTWLFDGEVVHRDSLGSEELIRPGEVNLMTAGRGVVHAEESARRHGRLHGMQLWIAQPEQTRHGDADFAHHTELPIVESRAATMTVFAGDLGGVMAPTRHGTALVGADVRMSADTLSLALRPDHEYCLVLVDGPVVADGHPVQPGRVAWLGRGRDSLELSAPEGARMLLLGGEPLPEPVFMWWNFVARTRDEVALMYRAWRDGDARFGEVSTALARIPAPVPPWEPLRVSDPGATE